VPQRPWCHWNDHNVSRTQEIGSETAKELLEDLFEANSWHITITGDFGVAIVSTQTWFKEAKVTSVQPFAAEASAGSAGSRVCAVPSPTRVEYARQLRMHSIYGLSAPGAQSYALVAGVAGGRVGPERRFPNARVCHHQSSGGE
jgi:hypothetical protein